VQFVDADSASRSITTWRKSGDLRSQVNKNTILFAVKTNPIYGNIFKFGYLKKSPFYVNALIHELITPITH
jgi:hypothetical protein